MSIFKSDYFKWLYVILLCLFVSTATVIGTIFRYMNFPETNVVVVYILSVVLIARFTNGYIWGILGTIAATCAYNIFFTEPYYTLHVNDPTYMITFTIMAITSIIISALTTKTNLMTQEAVKREQEKIISQAEAARERYRGNLLRAISHDLRTPLAGIMGTSEMLMRMTDQDDIRFNLAEGIYQDADWLHSLVENILSLTRIQDGRLPLNKEFEAAEEVVGAAIVTISKRAPEHEITVELPDELLLIPMDARLIQQVLVNLLDNAVKHTPPRREIRIQVAKDDAAQMARFCVSDQGSGISPEDLPNIFTMFYTKNNNRVDSHRGIGLGLTICESIVMAHGGRIMARNRGDGISGAEFIFTLPLTQPAEPQESAD